jgi:hypothetical protein
MQTSIPFIFEIRISQKCRVVPNDAFDEGYIVEEDGASEPRRYIDPA